jgi:hypothetical protein
LSFAASRHVLGRSNAIRSSHTFGEAVVNKAHHVASRVVTCAQCHDLAEGVPSVESIRTSFKLKSADRRQVRNTIIPVHHGLASEARSTGGLSLGLFFFAIFAIFCDYSVSLFPLRPWPT